MIKILSGKIRITEPDGKISPYERFIVTLNPDGSRTLRTVTRSPKGDLLRDVNQLLGPDWRDIESMGRVFFKGQALGTVLRRVVGDTLYSTVWSRDGGRDEATFEAPPEMILGFHAILSDAWKMNRLDTAHSDYQDILVHTVSPTWNGSTMGHGGHARSRARFDKTERLALPAGSFDCDKFIWQTSFDKELHVWRTGEANILARMLVAKGDKAGSIYELSEYEEEIAG
jgi:hypothetical protein